MSLYLRKNFYEVEIRLGNNILGFYITESIIWEKNRFKKHWRIFEKFDCKILKAQTIQFHDFFCGFSNFEGPVFEHFLIFFETDFFYYNRITYAEYAYNMQKLIGRIFKHRCCCEKNAK